MKREWKGFRDTFLGGVRHWRRKKGNEKDEGVKRVQRREGIGRSGKSGTGNKGYWRKKVWIYEGKQRIVKHQQRICSVGS